MPEISAVELTYKVGSKTIVNAANIQVNAGELVAVVGPNGAGKSTLIGLLAGDLNPTIGSVVISGITVDSASKYSMAQLRTVMSQRMSVSFPFTVEEVVNGNSYALSKFILEGHQRVHLCNDLVCRFGGKTDVHAHVTLNTDYGDNWAWYYKFELQHGDADKTKAVEKRCMDAEPTHGPLWCQVSKALENSKLSTLQVLKKVAALLES